MAVTTQAPARSGVSSVPATAQGASEATVKATVVAHGKHDKVRIFKLRRRKHYAKHQGHRQQYTELQIGAIAG